MLARSILRRNLPLHNEQVKLGSILGLDRFFTLTFKSIDTNKALFCNECSSVQRSNAAVIDLG